MCLGSFDTTFSADLIVRKPEHPKEQEADHDQAQDAQVSVDEILVQAVLASAEASNRAMKRRVRQRLHKKLGGMLSKEEFDVAMERFKEMEDKGPSKLVVKQNPPPAPVIFAVPLFLPMASAGAYIIPVTSSTPSVLSVNSQTSTCQGCEGPGSEDSSAFEDDLESCAEWCRARSEDAPVERTFIHFDTRMHVHRRSRSV